MVSQRQLAERQRVQGNALYSQGQYTAAFQLYETGLEAEKHNMALHGNAAQVLIKMGCYVQAIEHCDKVWSIAGITSCAVSASIACVNSKLEHAVLLGDMSSGYTSVMVHRCCILQSFCTIGRQIQCVPRHFGGEQQQERYMLWYSQHASNCFCLQQV